MHLRQASAVAAALLALSCASGGAAARSANDEVVEGVRVARLGYWQEAHFRFSRAHEIEPDDVVILNNLAVALEALGRYDEALASYKEALQKEPSNATVRKNYARFAEFFTSYARGAKPKGEDGATQ